MKHLGSCYISDNSDSSDSTQTKFVCKALQQLVSPIGFIHDLMAIAALIVYALILENWDWSGGRNESLIQTWKMLKYLHKLSFLKSIFCQKVLSICHE